MTERRKTTTETMQQMSIQQSNNNDNDRNKDNNINLNPSLRYRLPIIQRYPPFKTTIAAFIFFIGGLFFLSFGLSVFFSHIFKSGHDRGLAMIILGALSKCS